MITILLGVVLFFILLFVMARFYCLQKGFNQVIAGLNAIHEELREMNERKEKERA